MANLLKKINTLVTTPGMASAYWNWTVAKTLSKTEPLVACTENTTIGGWLGFSEYWHEYNGITNPEKLLLERCLKEALNPKQAVAMDIGANIGLFTVGFPDFGYSKVHAFEPIPTTYERLKANVIRNGFSEKVQLNCLAVGAEEGVLEFHVFAHNPACNRIVMVETDVETYKSEKKEIPVTTLDRYCSDQKIERVDFLKIDVEGMEPFVLKGAENLLKSHSVGTIFMELCPENLVTAGTTVQMLYESITQVGYRPCLLLENGQVGEELTVEAMQKVNWANILVIPK